MYLVSKHDELPDADSYLDPLDAGDGTDPLSHTRGSSLGSSQTFSEHGHSRIRGAVVSAGGSTPSLEDLSAARGVSDSSASGLALAAAGQAQVQVPVPGGLLDSEVGLHDIPAESENDVYASSGSTMSLSLPAGHGHAPPTPPTVASIASKALRPLPDALGMSALPPALAIGGVGPMGSVGAISSPMLPFRSEHLSAAAGRSTAHANTPGMVGMGLTMEPIPSPRHGGMALSMHISPAKDRLPRDRDMLKIEPPSAHDPDYYFDMAQGEGIADLYEDSFQPDSFHSV